jgi:hypothetical protein
MIGAVFVREAVIQLTRGIGGQSFRTVSRHGAGSRAVAARILCPDRRVQRLVRA